MRFAVPLLAALGGLPVAMGHTWIEQMRNIDADGNFFGEYGYPRGYKAKTDPGYDGNSMNYLLPPLEQQPPFINSTNLLCHPNQRKQEQSDKYPRLKTQAGGHVALRYMENGHISLPEQQVGKPEKAGTVYVFGTTDPKDDEKIADVLKWTADGQGGNKRGVLVGAQNYDDGRCYEQNNSPIHNERAAKFPNWMMGQVPDGDKGPGNAALFCETNIEIPKDAQTGKPYTLYWVWQWPTKPQTSVYTDGKDEYYTTCMDVDIVDTLKQDRTFKAKFPLVQQDAMSVAVSNFASRTALVDDPIKGELGNVFHGQQTQSGVQTTLQTSLATPPAATTGIEIPTLTDRPGASSAPSANPGGNNAVTIIVTERITVTAPAATAIVTASKQHVARHGARFRGMFTVDH
ncbi:hypothetical protein EJ04DRAFT_510131 [Polyplosphaeria fusca]|uniref:DUF7492 domain-containing protein n=1 Tax=Polyplosphaeria fusca TaxID=682080 RepID=A0A9P4V5Y4_9PLEO|nr:hypothetical protein EJ04DRAFT_510131 [Polyplosphaeria fusca]